jgi:asparagine synthase (glutamine-hydrolysing)
MCGIAGMIDGGGPADVRRDVVARMTATLAHRGPDADGLWFDHEAGVGLGHRRLAIVDLSAAGAQPMISACERYVLTYNGEVYNARELAAELAGGGVRFRGHSDTEVLVEACARWGVAAAVDRLIGMFAFALWDRHARTLTLVRDRLGIKPLYWAAFGDLFLFASELKALRAHPGWRPEIDRGALAAYLRFAYVPTPRTIYAGVSKLPPGCRLTVRAGEAPSVDRYWDVRRIAGDGRRARHGEPATVLVDRLQALLRDAVGRRMIADVPLGALLSGGIDSSTVTALMQEQSDRPVETFSIGFAEPRYDEAPHAAAVARHLGSDHHELYVSPDQARAVIPDLPRWYDEPFADSSQIPTYLLSRLVRGRLTVALSGDGGDEVFAGYNRYVWIDRLWRHARRIPAPARRAAAAGVAALPPRAWDRMAAAVLPRRRCPPQAGDKLVKLAQLAACPSPEAMYRWLVGHWQEPAEVLARAEEPPTVLDDPELPRQLPDLVQRLQVLDLATYLPDDILTKVDRASMAVALEVRVPLLDHRVVAFAQAVPPELQIRDGRGKWLLRQVLGRYVPDRLIDRPKTGFGVPIDVWLRGPLREWAEDLMDEQRLRREGLLDPAPVRRYWAEHLSGRRNWQYLIWTVLMLQAWRQRWMADTARPDTARPDTAP